jgi:hypothetical protein
MSRRRTFYWLICLLVAGLLRPGHPAAIAIAAEPTITGSERAAWDFTLLPDSVASSYQFAIYVDGVRSPLAGVNCSTTQAAATLTCTAPLPNMAAGRHTLQFVTLFNGTESERSASLVVQKTGSTPAPSPSPIPAPTPVPRTPIPSPGPIPLPDDDATARVPSDAGVLDPAAEPPTDAAVLPDGRVVFTDRTGVVSFLDREFRERVTALTLSDVALVDGQGLLGVAAHPRFDRNRYVYLAYTARRERGDTVYRVVRTREVGNTLGEIAVVLDGVAVAGEGAMSLRFGPDEKLYVALADAPAADAANAGRDRHPYLGTILRLEDDGATPRDSPASSPIYVRGIGVPRGLAWTADGRLWMATTDEAGCARIYRTGGPGIALGCDVIPRGIAAVRRAATGDIEFWMGALNRTGVTVLTASDDPLQPGAISLRRTSSVSRVGCVVTATNSEVLLCVDDAAMPVVRVP